MKALGEGGDLVRNCISFSTIVSRALLSNESHSSCFCFHLPFILSLCTEISLPLARSTFFLSPCLANATFIFPVLMPGSQGPSSMVSFLLLPSGNLDNTENTAEKWMKIF